jgi:hypothetical protein
MHRSQDFSNRCFGFHHRDQPKSATVITTIPPSLEAIQVPMKAW